MKVNQQNRVLKYMYNGYPMNETNTVARNPVFEFSDQVRNKQVCPITLLKFRVSLREHLRTHATFTVYQILRDFLRNYHLFSIKSNVLAIY